MLSGYSILLKKKDMFCKVITDHTGQRYKTSMPPELEADVRFCWKSLDSPLCLSISKEKTLMLTRQGGIWASVDVTSASMLRFCLHYI